MIRYIILALFVCILNVNCGDLSEEISSSDLIDSVRFIEESLVADGISSGELRITLNEDANPALAVVNCTLSNGLFVSNQDSVIQLTASRMENEIVATTRIRSTGNINDITINVAVNGFDHEEVIVPVEPSMARSLMLSANSFTVRRGFTTFINVVGVLRADGNRNVSIGHRVEIGELLSDSMTISGRFMNERLTSNNVSQVSFSYSPGLVDANQDLLLVGHVIDVFGTRTSITDTLEIRIIE